MPDVTASIPTVVLPHALLPKNARTNAATASGDRPSHSIWRDYDSVYHLWVRGNQLGFGPVNKRDLRIGIWGVLHKKLICGYSIIITRRIGLLES